MGQFIRHEECKKCSSSDGLGIYEDGTGYCFACESYFHADGLEGTEDEHKENRKVAENFSTGQIVGIPKRGLREDTCRKYGYQVAPGKQIAPYRNSDGKLVAQKIRRANKEFSIEGDGKNIPLFGQHLFKGGRTIVISEGEIDAMSICQAFDLKWPAVSLPNGAQSAVKAIKRAYDYLDGFENILLCFDNDEPGQDAIAEVAPVLPIGKVRIMKIPAPHKDANDALVGQGPQVIVKAFWDAMNGPVWRPDGIVSVSELRDRAKKPPAMGLPWCFDGLTKGTFGRRPTEVYTFGAGTGVGKTDLLTQQMEYDVNVLKLPIGIISPEQPNLETIRRIAGKADGKAYHVPDDSWDQETYERTVDKLADDDRIFLYNHFGKTDWEVIKQRIRYMHNVNGVVLFYIDHLTALADPTKERESLETIMAEIAGLAQELGLIIHLVSHLATPEGKSHEEGGRVMLKHFKGARAIGFWTFFAFGLERDKNTDDPKMRNIMTLRCLKDRATGRFDGCTIYLRYNSDTCRLEETTGFDDVDASGFDC